eukprot:TRINITY_DN64953_c0_g1_i1.p1 TRINITY_DN64953_c0_g1~~TRINITY_DN64953_c0_g1_i1.p1  ORF type:complete len:899 (+),score=303.63 TRINITY_DN64953_c0_g1_i1:73-2769(+)
MTRLAAAVLAGAAAAVANEPRSFYVLPCDKTDPMQQWTVSAGADGKAVIWQAYADQLCLDCSGCGPGSSPHSWGCNHDPASNTNNNQWFKVDGSKIVSMQTGTCLATVGTANAWTAVNMADCAKAGSSAAWAVHNDTKLIEAAGSGMCLYAGDHAAPNCSTAPLSGYDYCNPALPVDRRVADLMGRMTSEEKIAQLQSSPPGVLRLGLPPNRFNEALHGVVVNCGTAAPGSTGCPTSFPHALLLSASFNRTLWHSVGSTISTEARALNNQGIAGLLYWAPDINLFRDPRWGRGQEVPGEDPFLTGEYVTQYVRGMQEGEDTRYLKVVSTAKHFVAYDCENCDGIDRGLFDAKVPDADFVDYYLPQWRAAIRDARVQSIMCSYNGVNGVPACGNDLTMNQIARGEYGFDGFFVSDCGAFGDPFFTKYAIERFGRNYTQAKQIAAALQAGGDLNCGQFLEAHLGDALRAGDVQQSAIDQSVHRVLRETVRLGMLDPPEGQPYRQYGPGDVDNAASRQLSLEAAEQSIVLLKNDNGALPLKKTETVALFGPHFNSTQDLRSIYVGQNTLVESHSPLQAFEAYAKESLHGSMKGCANVGCTQDPDYEAAKAMAKGVDTAVVFLGLHPGQCNDACDNHDKLAREDEGFDRGAITLPGKQLQLLQAIQSVAKKTVLVLINGGAIDVSWAKTNVPAIVEAFYPGQLGGDAIVRILYGAVSPSGRLPVTYYDSAIVKNRKISEMGLSAKGGITYQYYQGTPLWEFGHGLSYTNFSYSWAAPPPAAVDTAGAVSDPPAYSVTVTNTGAVRSGVSVLAFLTRNATAGPKKELFDFQRAELAPGQSATLHFAMSPYVVADSSADGTQRIAPGPVHVTIGSLSHTVTFTGAPLTTFDLPHLRRVSASRRP